LGKIENYYHILGVSNTATYEEIRNAFRKKVKELHPDKEKGDAVQFNRVIEAYEALKDSEKRKRYDELLFKQNLKRGVTSSKHPTVTVIHLRKNNRISLSTVSLNAALLMIGILGNRYLKK
jgi:curved DNA-binding protein CbpA